MCNKTKIIHHNFHFYEFVVIFAMANLTFHVIHSCEIYANNIFPWHDSVLTLKFYYFSLSNIYKMWCVFISNIQIKCGMKYWKLVLMSFLYKCIRITLCIAYRFTNDFWIFSRYLKSKVELLTKTDEHEEGCICGLQSHSKILSHFLNSKFIVFWYVYDGN